MKSTVDALVDSLVALDVPEATWFEQELSKL